MIKKTPGLSCLFYGQVEVISLYWIRGKRSVRPASVKNCLVIKERVKGKCPLQYPVEVRGCAGRTISYPQQTNRSDHLPSDGVYELMSILRAYLSGAWLLSEKHTADGKSFGLKSMLLEEKGDIYSHTLTIHWLDKIREMVNLLG